MHVHVAAPWTAQWFLQPLACRRQQCFRVVCMMMHAWCMHDVLWCMRNVSMQCMYLICAYESILKCFGVWRCCILSGTLTSYALENCTVVFQKYDWLTIEISLFCIMNFMFVFLVNQFKSLHETAAIFWPCSLFHGCFEFWQIWSKSVNKCQVNSVYCCTYSVNSKTTDRSILPL
jgi:hypothetical protein